MCGCDFLVFFSLELARSADFVVLAYFRGCNKSGNILYFRGVLSADFAKKGNDAKRGCPDRQPHIIYISATIAAVRPAVPREVRAPPCESSKVSSSNTYGRTAQSDHGL